MKIAVEYECNTTLEELIDKQLKIWYPIISIILQNQFSPGGTTLQARFGVI